MERRKEDLIQMLTVDWKKGNMEYFDKIEKFLDTVDNIKDEDLKKRIIFGYFNCEQTVSESVMKYLENVYFNKKNKI